VGVDFDFFNDVTDLKASQYKIDTDTPNIVHALKNNKRA
jgi:hypothetical protein